MNITTRDLTINMRGFKYTDNKGDTYGGIFGIVSNGSKNNVVISMERCNINNAKIGMYIPARGNSKTTVNSCNIYSGTGISAKGGSLDVLNSVIHAYDDDIEISPGPNNNGSNPASEALYIEGNYSGEMQINVEKSNLTSDYGYAVRKAFDEGDTEKILKIKSGDFKGKLGSVLTDTSKKLTEITGGKFSSNVSALCGENYQCVEKNGVWEVVPKN